MSSGPLLIQGLFNVLDVNALQGPPAVNFCLLGSVSTDMSMGAHLTPMFCSTYVNF